jgi:hypothetical protein
MRRDASGQISVVVNGHTRHQHAVRQMLISRFTQLMCSSADVFGLLRFGHFRPFNDWDDFRRWIVRIVCRSAHAA